MENWYVTENSIEENSTIITINLCTKKRINRGFEVIMCN